MAGRHTAGIELRGRLPYHPRGTAHRTARITPARAGMPEGSGPFRGGPPGGCRNARTEIPETRLPVRVIPDLRGRRESRCRPNPRAGFPAGGPTGCLCRHHTWHGCPLPRGKHPARETGADSSNPTSRSLSCTGSCTPPTESPHAGPDRAGRYCRNSTPTPSQNSQPRNPTTARNTPAASSCRRTFTGVSR